MSGEKLEEGYSDSHILVLGSVNIELKNKVLQEYYE